MEGKSLKRPKTGPLAVQTTSAVREYDANDKIKAPKQLPNGPRGEGFIRQPLFPRLRTLFASQLGATAQREIRGRKEQDGRPPATYTEPGRGGCNVAGRLKTSSQVCGGDRQEVEEAVGGAG